MFRLTHSIAPLLFLGAGCASDSDSAAIDQSEETAWSTLEPRPLNAFRLMRTTEFPNGISPTELIVDPFHGPAMVMDRSAGVIWATDKLYLHDPRIACLHPNDPARIEHLQPGQGCPDTTIETRRGRIDIGGPPVAMAMDTQGGTLSVMNPSGHLSRINTDPLGGPSIDHMRPMAGPSLALSATDLSGSLLAASRDQLALAVGSEISIFSQHGIRTDAFDAGETITDLHIDDEGWWALTESQLFHNGEAAGPGGSKLLVWNDEPWVIGSQVVTGAGSEVRIPELTGPGAVWGDKLIVATTTGLTRIDADLTTEEVFTGGVLDVATNHAAEVLVLGTDGALSVYVDEHPADDAAPLYVWANAFLERPRHSGEIRGCTVDDPLSLSAMHGMAEAQLRLLRDLPIKTALGVTPNHMRDVVRCEAQRPMAGMLTEVDLGILFHDTPEVCEADDSCYEAALRADIDIFPYDFGWVSGLAPHTELDLDWVAALSTLDVPNRLNFFGTSLLPAVPHDDDLRSKEAWPQSLGQHTRAWAVDSVDDVPDMHETGSLWVLPGNNVSAFNLGACQNLFVNECHPLGRGDGGTLTDADIASLDLLLHRALTSARGEGVHTWNFHIPDIGVYDFTEACTVEQGIWSGAECEGARLQRWLFDVHQRFALSESVIWSSPSELPL